jgi:FtsZ-interacting cell division protein ZipA
MSKLSKVLIAAGAIAGIVVIGIVLSRRPGQGPESDMQVSASEPPPPASAETNGFSFITKRARHQPAQAATSSQQIGASDAAANLITAWGDKVDDILGSTNSEPDKARQMLEMFPRLPAEGQEAVARHLSNLVPDQDYGLLRAYLTNASLPEDVLDVLLDDALNRPNSLKLPALLEVARNPQNPKAAEAKDFLELFLDEDYGNDWDKWQAGIQQWLKDNPD